MGADGAAYALELGGDESDAENVKKKTETYRVIATAMTLPDIAYGGARLAKELLEIRQLGSVDRVTAQAATNMSARTSNATRADRLRQIAERANLRAPIRSEQILAALKLEVTSRGGGTGSLALLIREEINNEESPRRTRRREETPAIGACRIGSSILRSRSSVAVASFVIDKELGGPSRPPQTPRHA